jgi:hypothetical protein
MPFVDPGFKCRYGNMLTFLATVGLGQPQKAHKRHEHVIRAG